MKQIPLSLLCLTLMLGSPLAAQPASGCSVTGTQMTIMAAQGPLFCCPFCGPPSLTNAEKMDQKDAVVLVQWTEAVKPKGTLAGTTSYKVTEILKNTRGEALEVGDLITLVQYRAGQPGDLFMLFGRQKTTIDWGIPMEVTETSFNYIKQAPSPEVPNATRLEYFVKFLEFPDSVIANDAYAEFANAPYEDVVAIKEKMPRERLKKWLSSKATDPTRFGLYGLMMGLCGTADDAEFLEERILEKTDGNEFRLGIDGMMAGYLLLTGADGLDIIDKAKLKPKYLRDDEGNIIKGPNGKPKLFPFSETYAAMQALRFMWTYGDGRIPKERLRQSMRLLLERPELGDLVIADLARWKDWSVQDKLMELFKDEEYNTPSIKRSIVRYMLVSTQDIEENASSKPVHVVNGTKYVEQLRKIDPDIVEQAERFFIVN